MGSCTSLKERLAAPFYCRKKPRYDAYIVSYQGKLGYHYFRDLQGITFFQILVQKLSFDQPLAADPEDQLAVLAVGDIPQFVDPNSGIGRSLFQRQIALLPNGYFLHIITSNVSTELRQP